MSEMIGATAGKVWEFLKTNGPAPAKKIQKGIGESAALTNQAIGWLARESKLAVDRSQKNDPTYALRE
jgi:hypothetical protein